MIPSINRTIANYSFHNLIVRSNTVYLERLPSINRFRNLIHFRKKCFDLLNIRCRVLVEINLFNEEMPWKSNILSGSIDDNKQTIFF